MRGLFERIRSGCPNFREKSKAIWKTQKHRRKSETKWYVKHIEPKKDIIRILPVGEIRWQWTGKFPDFHLVMVRRWLSMGRVPGNSVPLKELSHTHSRTKDSIIEGGVSMAKGTFPRTISKQKIAGVVNPVGVYQNGVNTIKNVLGDVAGAVSRTARPKRGKWECPENW